MSELVTNKITPATGSSDTVTLGDSGDTFTIPAGVTLAGSGASLTALPAENLTGTVADARISALTASKLTGDLPAISGANLTGVGVTGITSSANVTAISISADEEVSMPLQPCFNVTAAAQTDQTGDGTIHTANLTQEVFDVGGNFANKMFTAPITGKYILCASLTWVAGMWGTSDSVNVSIITSNRTYIQYQEQTNAAARDMGAFSMAHVADMDAGDTAKITWYISGGSKISDHAAGYYTVLSGCLIA
jgi:hypothetical protein